LSGEYTDKAKPTARWGRKATELLSEPGYLIYDGSSAFFVGAVIYFMVIGNSHNRNNIYGYKTLYMPG